MTWPSLKHGVSFIHNFSFTLLNDLGIKQFPWNDKNNCFCFAFELCLCHFISYTSFSRNLSSPSGNPHILWPSPHTVTRKSNNYLARFRSCPRGSGIIYRSVVNFTVCIELPIYIVRLQKFTVRGEEEENKKVGIN